MRLQTTKPCVIFAHPTRHIIPTNIKSQTGTKRGDLRDRGSCSPNLRASSSFKKPPAWKIIQVASDSGCPGFCETTVTSGPAMLIVPADILRIQSLCDPNTQAYPDRNRARPWLDTLLRRNGRDNISDCRRLGIIRRAQHLARRIAAHCAHVDACGAFGIRAGPTAAILRRWTEGKPAGRRGAGGCGGRRKRRGWW